MNHLGPSVSMGKPRLQPHSLCRNRGVLLCGVNQDDQGMAPARDAIRRGEMFVASDPCAATPSLYDRLGGVYAIAAVVDDFIDRIMVDPRLNANPKVDEAHHRVSRAGFKYLVTEMVCWATGGPQRYTGRTMLDSHSHLAITEEEWQAFLDDFRQTLATFRVPEIEQRELFAIVESTKQDIVVSAGAGEQGRGS